MANPGQWTVDAFYAELKKLDTAGRQSIAGLNAQKLRLQNEYSLARNKNDETRMAFLRPLISKNSALRIQARDFAAKYNDAVGKVSTLVRNAGFTVPPVMGLGIAPALVIVPAAVVASLLILWGIVNSMNRGRDAIDHALATDAPALLKIANDSSKSADERKAALAAYNKILDQAGAADDWTQMVIPALGIVLAIVVAPTLLKSMPRRAA